MKRSVVLLLCAVLCNHVYAQQKNNGQLIAAFDKVLNEEFKINETGAVALVSRNGKIIYKKAFGMANLELNVPMNPDNIFRIGSITKQFTAVAILQLAEQGKLDIKDDIRKFIPGYPTQGNTITIEHLLTHTSGIQDFTAIKGNVSRSATDYTPKEMIDYFKDQPVRFAPGTRYEYSNSGYFLLGYIIEHITGKTYAQYVEENIFLPLGMKNSSYAGNSIVIKNRAAGYSRGEKGIENASYISMTQPYAAGAVLSTAEDLFKWNQALQSNKLLKKETLAKAFTKFKLNDGAESNYGYGFRLGYIQESESIWHGGLINGFMSMAMYLPGKDVYVVVLSNCDCKSPVDVTEKLATLASGKPYDHKVIQPDTATLSNYAGVYQNAKGQQAVFSTGHGQAYFQQGRSPKAKISAFATNKFFFPNDPMVTIEFTGRNNTVDKLIVHSRTANETWTRTNKPVDVPVEIKVNEKILETYVGEYEINPDFIFTITKEQDKLFLTARGQQKVEIFADAENKFFLKVNGAQLEFVKDNSGKVFKAMLTQGTRQTDAKKIK